MEDQFNIYANIVNSRLQELIQIYITERKENSGICKLPNFKGNFIQK